jgi:hypothetical protein
MDIDQDDNALEPGAVTAGPFLRAFESRRGPIPLYYGATIDTLP